MGDIPVYVVAPGGPLREACLAAVPGAAAVDPPLRPGAFGGLSPGVVAVDVAGVGAPELVSTARALAAEPGWTLVVIEAGTPLVVRTVSVGFDHSLDELAAFAADPAAGGHLLELHRVLTEVARARHDINNPLTSAMAETQILLMEDAEEGSEAREALLTIQEQLRRIRDLVAATRHLRPHR